MRIASVWLNALFRVRQNACNKTVTSLAVEVIKHNNFMVLPKNAAFFSAFCQLFQHFKIRTCIYGLLEVTEFFDKNKFFIETLVINNKLKQKRDLL